MRPGVPNRTLKVDALGSTQPLWWACFAEELRHLWDARDGGGLCKAMGLGHIKDGEWLLVWRYDARWTRFFCRPTVVEAGGSPYHYPTPPSARFAVTMSLDTALPACRELLHQPLRGRFAIEGCTGELLRVEGMGETIDPRLTELRSHHRQRLEEEHNDATAVSWRQRHFPDP